MDGWWAKHNNEKTSKRVDRLEVKVRLLQDQEDKFLKVVNKLVTLVAEYQIENKELTNEPKK